MGLQHLRPPEDLIERLRRFTQLRLFVETGTHLGATAVWAQKHFEHVWTIEASEDLYNKVVEENCFLPNVEFLFGDSRSMLPKVLPNLTGATLFWLDAHYSGNGTYGVLDECPILSEIDIINQSRFANVIIIDDARCFLSPPHCLHQAEQWPDITSILAALNLVPNRYIVILEDLIVTVPLTLKPPVVAYCQHAASAIDTSGVRVSCA